MTTLAPTILHLRVEEARELNPLIRLIRLGAPDGAALPGFHDVVLGGNAVANAGPGYDLATGLGTPDVDNLARNILILRKLRP